MTLTTKLTLFVLCWIGWGTTQLATAQEAYLCITDMATGFAFDEKRKAWHETHFEVGKKYLVSKSKRPGIEWEVKEIGHRIAIIACADFNESGNLFYSNSMHNPSVNSVDEFKMSRKTLRFLSVYSVGFWTDGPSSSLSRLEGQNTPFMEIGKCSPL